MSDQPKRELKDEDLAVIDRMVSAAIRVLASEMGKYLDEQNVRHVELGVVALPTIVDAVKNAGDDQVASAHVLVASTFNDTNTVGVLETSLHQLKQRNYKRVSHYGDSSGEAAWAAPWSRGDA